MFSWFKRSAAKATPQHDWVEYKGYRLCATPIREGSQYRVSGIIELDGEPLKSHTFTRADLIGDEEEAKKFSMMKAQLMVDQLGEGLFD